jgi:hypothetical protein
MSTIVTHPGSAHRDEFMACCLAIAAGKCGRIERRDSTDEDLNDPNVIVLDQGGRHEPALMNFDHHQLPRDAAPTCSITLILPYLGIDVEKARSIWGWLEFSELLDSKGPFATAEKLGSTPDALFAGVSPIETTVLRWFEELELIGIRGPLYALMHRIGKEKLDYLNKVTERIEHLRENAKVVEVGGLRFVDGTCIDRADNPVLGLEMFAEELGDIAGTITQDDRGEGLSLFRRNDHPAVDFSRLEGRDGVVFAHKGGFVAKLEGGVDPLLMIEKAVDVPCGV